MNEEWCEWVSFALARPWGSRPTPQGTPVRRSTGHTHKHTTRTKKKHNTRRTTPPPPSPHNDRRWRGDGAAPPPPPGWVAANGPVYDDDDTFTPYETPNTPSPPQQPARRGSHRHGDATTINRGVGPVHGPPFYAGREILHLRVRGNNAEHNEALL